jgi:hypothetical protein
MPARPTWMVAMGDGTWAVSCSRCQLPLYRGAEQHAKRVYREHRCEPVVLLGRRASVRNGGRRRSSGRGGRR